MEILCRGTLEGQIICQNLQMKLPSKKEKANIWKYGKAFLCIFTFVNMVFFSFCIRCELSSFCIQSMSLQTDFRNIFLFSSLQMFKIWGKNDYFISDYTVGKSCPSGDTIKVLSVPFCPSALFILSLIVRKLYYLPEYKV